MTTYNLCLIGFGNIGRALARLLLAKRTALRDNYSIEWRITGIAARRMGWIADPRGLDVEEFLDGVYDYRPLSSSPTNVQEWLAAAQADVLFEVSSLNVQTGQPAIAHLQAALEHGAHAITANKGPLVYASRELEALARFHGKRFLYEATVMGGSPTFSLFRETLPALTVLRVRGILNSTTNVILDEMEKGRTFAEGVKRAQELGVAETDPSADVDGWDAAVKVCAIAQILMRKPLKLEEIEREGIRVCWLLGTSVRKIDMLRMIEQASLPKPMRGEYNKQCPFCLYSLAMHPFHKGEVQFVLHVFTFIKQRVCFRFHAFQERFLRRMKPPTTSFVLGTLADLTRGKSELRAENALLRHQLVILQRHIKRPVYRKTDRLLLVFLASMTGAWKQALFLVQPETILRWHRELFRVFWKHKSKVRSKKPRLSSETIAFIKQIAANNRLWGAERIRGELLKLDIRVSKRTIQKYMRQIRAISSLWTDLENVPP